MEEFKEIKGLINESAELEKILLLEAAKSINVIIKCSIHSEKEISRVFDSMLSLMFVDYSMLHREYYRLLEYTKTFDNLLASDYERLFIEFFEEDIKDNYIK